MCVDLHSIIPIPKTLSNVSLSLHLNITGLSVNFDFFSISRFNWRIFRTRLEYQMKWIFRSNVLQSMRNGCVALPWLLITCQCMEILESIFFWWNSGEWTSTNSARNLGDFFFWGKVFFLYTIITNRPRSSTFCPESISQCDDGWWGWFFFVIPVIAPSANSTQEEVKCS